MPEEKQPDTQDVLHSALQYADGSSVEKPVVPVEEKVEKPVETPAEEAAEEQAEEQAEEPEKKYSADEFGKWVMGLTKSDNIKDAKKVIDNVNFTKGQQAEEVGRLRKELGETKAKVESLNGALLEMLNKSRSEQGKTPLTDNQLERAFEQLNVDPEGFIRDVGKKVFSELFESRYGEQRMKELTAQRFHEDMRAEFGESWDGLRDVRRELFRSAVPENNEHPTLPPEKLYQYAAIGMLVMKNDQRVMGVLEKQEEEESEVVQPDNSRNILPRAADGGPTVKGKRMTTVQKKEKREEDFHALLTALSNNGPI